MNTVLIGGSRRIIRLPTVARNLVNNVVEQSLEIMVGDANGVDKVVQKHLAESQ